MTEVWKAVSGYDKNYEVSNLGNVREGSVALHQSTLVGGYKRVILYKGGKRKTVLIHSLVLETFVGPRPGAPRKVHGAHNDGDPSNNILSNLEWKTVAKNHADKLAHGTDFNGEKNPAVKLTTDQVTQIKDRLKIAKWGDVSRLAKEYGVDQTTISDIKTGRTWADAR